MSVTNVTREELWAKQHLSCKNMDYAVWERDKSMLQKLSRINGGCSFVVDVYKDVMRMLLRVLSIGWGMTGTR